MNLKTAFILYFACALMTRRYILMTQRRPRTRFHMTGKWSSKLYSTSMSHKHSIRVLFRCLPSLTRPRVPHYRVLFRCLPSLTRPRVPHYRVLFRCLSSLTRPRVPHYRVLFRCLPSLTRPRVPHYSVSRHQL